VCLYMCVCVCRTRVTPITYIHSTMCCAKIQQTAHLTSVHCICVHMYVYTHVYIYTYTYMYNRGGSVKIQRISQLTLVHGVRFFSLSPPPPPPTCVHIHTLLSRCAKAHGIHTYVAHLDLCTYVALIHTYVDTHLC